MKFIVPVLMLTAGSLTSIGVQAGAGTLNVMQFNLHNIVFVMQVVLISPPVEPATKLS